LIDLLIAGVLNRGQFIRNSSILSWYCRYWKKNVLVWYYKCL